MNSIVPVLKLNLRNGVDGPHNSLQKDNFLIENNNNNNIIIIFDHSQKVIWDNRDEKFVFFKNFYIVMFLSFFYIEIF
jgi:hypothetical protein